MSDTITTPDLFDIYSKAANVLEHVGWVQEQAVQDGKYCATAAINKVAGRNLNDLSTDLFEPFATWLRANRADQIEDSLVTSGAHTADCKTCRDAWGRSVVQNWNDLPGRTKEEVLSALREFAVTAVTNPGEEK